eukprot:667200-Pyramimonas_sp.AAC.2
MGPRANSQRPPCRVGEFTAGTGVIKIKWLSLGHIACCHNGTQMSLCDWKRSLRAMVASDPPRKIGGM